MLTFETLAAGYFVAVALASPFSGALVRRFVPISVVALLAAGGVVIGAFLLPPAARGWLAHAYLAAGYWLPALLVSRQPGAFERWLRRTEPASALNVWSRGHVAEFAYLCCYPLVPAAFAVVYLCGTIADVDRFWTTVLGAGFICYITLPWLVSRPPRLVEPPRTDTSRVRRANLQVLDRFSHGWNTFPSGHVAVAASAALSAHVVAPRADLVFMIVAAGVAVGAVRGRYHYIIDALIGIVVGTAAFTISNR
jgi:membrane-associated phospholipid phosphatase